MNADQLSQTIIKEIQTLEEEGTIPKGLLLFEDLHKYVDANMLGDSAAVFDAMSSGGGEEAVQAACDVLNEAQRLVEHWLRNRPQ